MTTAAGNGELKKGSAELLILSLIESRPRHGYELARLIEQRSGGALRFNAASLYPLLFRMEDAGWIDGKWVEKVDSRRRHAPDHCQSCYPFRKRPRMRSNSSMARA